MDVSWAAEQLQTIRTLMERSALYRRALAPVMIFNGVVGCAAALAGWAARINTPRGFILLWMGVAVVAVAGSFLLVRRQALRAAEPFWSPPTRRITWAFLPPLVGGLAIGSIVLARIAQAPENAPHPILKLWSDALQTGQFPDLPEISNYVLLTGWLPWIWVVLYGCACCAAGFFMPRGLRLFGWVFVLGGCAVLALGLPDWRHPFPAAHGIMGGFFGLLHLAYGLYLNFTEPRGNET